jgi:hypothetical protein
MKNIFVVPTTDATRLMRMFDHDRDELELSLQCCGWQYGVHVNITSYEEIKEGDWCIDLDTDNVFRLGNWTTGRVVKIILTTAPTLIADGVQAINSEFLEWFIKNPTCEFVEIQKTLVTNSGLAYKEYAILSPDFIVLEVHANIPQSHYVVGQTTELDDYEYDTNYKIIIPQEEPKQDSNKTHHLDELPNVDKGVVSKMYNAAIPKLEPKQEAEGKYFADNADSIIVMKQETLEEAALKYKNLKLPDDLYDAFIRGANWKAECSYSEEEPDYDKIKEAFVEMRKIPMTFSPDERMYSEEEVIALLEYTRENFYDTGTKWHSEPDTDLTSEELVQQFKKK